MPESGHVTVPVQVWVDVDEGIADFVRRLQLLPGIRTHTSCQGSRTYGPYVMASWIVDARAELEREGCTFDVEGVDDGFDGWGYIHPRCT